MDLRYRTANGMQRVVVTGLGAVTPLGLDVASTWEAVLRGESGVRPITVFDASALSTRIAASIQNFDGTRYMEAKEARRTALFILYAVAAAAQAVAHAGLDPAAEPSDRIGVEFGSALGGTAVVEEQRLILESRGPRLTNPAVVPSVLVNSAACAVAIRYGIHGPVRAPVAACTTGAIAIGDAYRHIAWGEADVIIAGGTDSVMTPLAINGFARLGALSSKNDTPGQACAPFSGDRDGTVVGEGAASLVLETLEHAERRGAPILAELVGYGLTCDAFHLVAPDPNGSMAARAMRQALAQAGIGPEDVDWICAHGTATQLNDASETTAIKAAFGEHAYRVPISSNKGSLGHMLGAAGAISSVLTVKAMSTGVIPPTINYRMPDPACDLDYVPNIPRQATLRTVIVNAFGFGGQNACLVFRK